MWSLKIQNCTAKQRQLANNQHEISGLGYIATEAAGVLLTGAQAKSLKNTLTMS